MTDPCLRIKGVSKRFPGIVALNQVNLKAYSGEALALMGANGAGKSTLMNILGGIETKDEGEITVDEEQLEFHSPIDSLEKGIAFVSQEINSLPTMTIAENIFADAFPHRYGRIDFPQIEEQAKQILTRLGSHLAPHTLVETLNTGDRQIIEIARSLRRSPRILIFDEPTSSLSNRERQQLFEVISALKQDGVAIIYITHFIEEIFTICERVTVMRNGETVFNGTIDSINPNDVVHQMMGSVENESRLTPYRGQLSDIVLEVNHLNRADQLSEISFTVRSGEIVGIWGLLGSGRTELLRAMVGLDPIDGGKIRWRVANGELAEITPSLLQTECGFVTEDRRGEGLFLPQSTTDNIVMPSLRKIANALGLVDRRKQRELSESMIRRLNIKVTDRNQKTATLSGGNQQKVVFARWLATSPRLFLLDEPTRGLDVGAKTEILKLVAELSKAGSAILLVSSELEELTRICDRYLIMVRGKIIGEMAGTSDEHELIAAISEDSAQPGRSL